MTRRCLAAKAKAVITGECVGHSGFAFEWTSPAQLSSHFTGAVWIVIPHIEICEEVLMWDHFQNFMYKQDGPVRSRVFYEGWLFLLFIYFSFVYYARQYREPKKTICFNHGEMKNSEWRMESKLANEWSKTRYSPVYSTLSSSKRKIDMSQRKIFTPTWTRSHLDYVRKN